MKFLRKENIMCFKTKVSLLMLALFIGAGVFSMSVQPAQAASLAELQQIINNLKAQIIALQERLTAVQQGEEDPGEWCHTFNTNLRIGDKGVEVRALRTALATEGFSGLEAMGGAYEFDERIASAVVGFQEKYTKEVLSQWGLKHGTGFVGKSTRAKLNKLYGCGITPFLPVPPVLPVGECDTKCQAKGYDSGICRDWVDVSSVEWGCKINELDIGRTSDCIVPQGSVGTSWTARSAAEANGWSSVTYGNGLFVAVAHDGTNQVMTSPDGINWTAYPAAEANRWDSVTYGNGLFVAVAHDGTNQVMTSPDGINWTAYPAAEANGWDSVTYGNGLFVAVAYDGMNQVMTSPDGINWTVYPAAEANVWSSVTYGNGLFVAVASDGRTNQVMTSPDGINWTARSEAGALPWSSVTYGNGLFVAVSDISTTKIMTSPDGINWTARSVPEANRWYSVTYGNGLFVAVAYSGANRVMTSPDGINWTAYPAAEANVWHSVTYGNGLFVAVADSGMHRVMTLAANKTCCCQKEEQEEPVQPVEKCTDSDGGIEKYVKGTACKTLDSNNDIFYRTDRCIPAPDGYIETDVHGYLTEYYCKDNKIFSKTIYCENGCENGACKGEVGYDKCEYGRGWSEPRSAAERCGWPVGAEGYKKDCCCCYTHSHIHDLGKIFEDKQVLIEYEPGLNKGCESTMVVSSSVDGKQWERVLTASVKQETWSPKTIYEKTINVSGRFRYIKIYIPQCYNDYSSAKVMGGIEPYITVTSPNGGEIIKLHEVFDITWKSTGVDDAYIYLWFPDGGACKLADVSAKQKKYSAVIMKDEQCPNIPSLISAGQYKILIHTEVEGIKDSSDDYFSIVAAEALACTDTDGGKNYYVKGTLTFPTTAAGTGGIGTQDDVCIDGSVMAEYGSVLAEYYCDCDRESVELVNYTCPNGCADGACIKGDEPYCSAIGSRSEGWYENGDLIEYDNCDGCYAVCKAIGTRSEGWHTAGNCDTGLDLIKYDNCGEDQEEPSITVISPNGGEEWVIGQAYDIKWVTSNWPDNTPVQISLNPMHGGDHFIMLTPNDGIENYTVPSEGIVPGNNFIIKMHCPTETGNYNCPNDVAVYDFSDDYFSIVAAGTQTCADSDHGKDYYTKGTTKLNGQEKVDVCRYSYMDPEHTIAYDCVIEYFCQSDNLIGEEKHYCPYGCSNGACKPGITVLSADGGEELVIGELYMITWDSRGLNNVTIEIGGYDENNNPIRQWHIISDNFYFVGTKGSVDWIVPSDIKEKFQIAPVKYKIRVRNVGLPILVSDESDDYFSIKEHPSTIDNAVDCVNNGYYWGPDGCYFGNY